MGRFKVRDFVKAIIFDGTNDDVTFSGYTPPSTFSVAFWVMKQRVTGSNNDRFVDCCAGGPTNGFTIIQGTGNAPLRFEIYAASQQAAISTDNLVTGKWYFIVATFTTNSAKIYQDAVLKATDTSCSMGTVATTLTLGRRATGASNYCKALMDEFMLFNKVLTQDEITALYVSGTVPSGLEIYLNFDDNVTDQSGNSNSSSASGTPAYSTNVRFNSRTAVT